MKQSAPRNKAPLVIAAILAVLTAAFLVALAAPGMGVVSSPSGFPAPTIPAGPTQTARVETVEVVVTATPSPRPTRPPETPWVPPTATPNRATSGDVPTGERR